MNRKNVRAITPIPQYLTRDPNGKEYGYIRITPSLTSSYAYSQLSPLAIVLYIDMLMTASGSNTVMYTQQMAYRHHKTSKSGYTAAIKQLTEWGFISRMPRACYAPSTYRFEAGWKKFSQTE